VWSCKLNEGKTQEDAQAINAKWLKRAREITCRYEYLRQHRRRRYRWFHVGGLVPRLCNLGQVDGRR
jgi:hypothetical protein